MQRGLVGSEMCIRDRYQRRVHGSFMATNLRKKSLVKGSVKSETITLPGDVLTDLKNVISLFKKKGDTIARSEFRIIMHNFGHYSIRQKEFEEELRKFNFDPKQPYFTESEIISVITNLWNLRGREEEARDCFKVFDKQDKRQINVHDIKRVLEENEIPFTPEDITDLLQEVDPDNKLSLIHI
eukprot:TRINITY_DN5793_c0_g1_i1.p1 TRINITY_DN5793_c0_g1~~TRINITY_DN5793_c0_g1_i1.p1  ORF type:complete len:183 (-),score=41.64 TRINITY_DN5793_c0_g1_i1:172-720(-)